MNTNKSKQGFTLVELSIVLVIIGLLIGGILAAQSMIKTTQVQAFVRQVGQFDSAVANFQDKFGALPGDSATAVGGTAGDGDGVIESDATNSVVTWTGEIANFWVMLQTSGFKNEDGGTYVSTTPTAGLSVTRAPQAKAGSNASFFAAGNTATDVFNTNGDVDDITANAYVSTSCTTGSTTTLACVAAFTGPDALAIDTKMDDGAGDTGNVGAATTAAVVSTAAPLTAESIAYVATNTSPTYSLVIRMGISTGDLK